jgi:uncharacterized membrane protein YebE (DUF533 family)
MTSSTSDRVGHALGSGGLSQPGNPIGDLLRSFQGGGQSPGFSGLAEAAQSMFGDAKQSVQSGNPLAVGGLAALAGAVLGGGSGAMKGALGGGALALLGSIAMSALKNYQAGAARDTGEIAKDAPLGLREPQTPAEEQELERTAHLILQAMIAAAKADGQIDGAEMQRIAGKLEAAGADQEGREFVLAELQKPLDLEGLIRGVRSPEVAAQAYAASLLAIEVDTAAERDYLRRLATGLGLDDRTVQRLHQIVNAPAVT